MRLPPVLRTSAFRMTLLFVGLFAVGAAAFLAYIYGMTAMEVKRISDAGIAKETDLLEKAYAHGGRAALERALVTEAGSTQQFVFVLVDSSGRQLWSNIARAPKVRLEDHDSVWMRFKYTTPAMGGVDHPARAEWRRLSGGERLLVGADNSEAEFYVFKIGRALWGAGALVVMLGLTGGLMVSHKANLAGAELNATIAAVRGGDLTARAVVRGAGGEFEDLAVGLNNMLDRLEHSIESLRHAGDAIAHDLRSPLTRLRTRLEVALLDLEAGRGDPKAAIIQAPGGYRGHARHLRHRAGDRPAGSRRRRGRSASVRPAPSGRRRRRPL